MEVTGEHFFEFCRQLVLEVCNDDHAKLLRASHKVDLFLKATLVSCARLGN